MISTSDPRRPPNEYSLPGAQLKSGQKTDAGQLAVIAFAGSAFGAFLLIYALSDDVPPNSELQTVSGMLYSYEEVQSGRAASSKTPRFKLRGDDRVFQYVSKGGKIGTVIGALRSAGGKTVTISIDDELFSPPFDDIELYTVYAIEIEGVAIRRYDDVAAAWRADNVVGVYLGAFFLVVGFSVGAVGVWNNMRRH